MGVKVAPQLLNALNHDDGGDLHESQEANGAVDAFDLSPEAVVRGIDAPEHVEGDGRVLLHNLDQRLGIRPPRGNEVLNLRDGRGKGRKRER
jgi:hypothetical protein